MTIEAVLFYGAFLEDADADWKRLLDDHGGNSETVIRSKFSDDERHAIHNNWAAGCAINMHGDLRYEKAGYYVAIAETERAGRVNGERLDPSMVEPGAVTQSTWDGQLTDFLNRLGLQPRHFAWRLTFWFC